MLLLCVAITLCVVAWGFLAFTAIDFGRSARGGESSSWAYLALACVGAAACLFVGMILVSRLLVATGIIRGPQPETTGSAEPWPGESTTSTGSHAAIPADREPDDTVERPAIRQPRAPGGKRAAR